MRRDNANLKEFCANLTTGENLKPGPDLILPILVKQVRTIINEPLETIINEMIINHIFPQTGKIAHVTPAFKPDKDDRQEKSYFRLLSGIGTFSKILERYIHNKISYQIINF